MPKSGYEAIIEGWSRNLVGRYETLEETEAKVEYDTEETG